MGRASSSSSCPPSMQSRICQVCGSAGQIKNSITCAGCRSACEHTYCAQAPPPPNQLGAWFCETCSKERGSTGENLSSSNGQLPYRSAPLVWKGSLKVFQLAGYLSVELSAYLPLQLSRRLYNSTQTLPAELETKTVSRSTAWPKQFQIDSPNFEDIGVFLLPSDRRSSLKCTSLIRQLDSGRYALKMKISSSIELFIYSSQVLEENCQRLGGDFFLWGLFWKRKTRNGFKRADEAKSEREDRQFTAHIPSEAREDEPLVPPPESREENNCSFSINQDRKIEPESATVSLLRTKLPIFHLKYITKSSSVLYYGLTKAPVVMETVTLIAGLNQQTEFARIVARVIRLWCASNLSTGKAWAMNFVLLDSEGMAIEGQMLLAQYQCVSQYFVEGAIYEFAQFKVEQCHTKYPIVAHRFSINFTGDTTITPLPSSPLEIPFYYFEFARFEDIGTSITGNTTVVDIIGRLVAIDPVKTIQNGGRPVRIQCIHLVNERDFSVEITIWEHMLHVLPLEVLIELSKEGPVVLAFNSLQLRTNRGRTTLKTYSGTLFHFHQNLPFIASFRARSLQGQFNPVTVNVAQPLTVQNVSSSFRMTNSQPLRITIAELLRMDGYNSTGKQFQCVAKIVNIKNPSNWYYESCFNCHKKLKKDGAHQWHWCPCCRKWRERPVLWYYLALQVADIDNTATTEFKLFGNQAEHTVGLPASQVRHEPNPHQYLLPPSLRALIGKVGIFTVKFELGLHHLGQVSFKVYRYDALPLNAQLPAQEAPPLPVHVTPLPLPRRDIAESSGHAARDKGKRKADESLPAQRQLGDEPDSSYRGKRPFIFSQGYYQARR